MINSASHSSYTLRCWMYAYAEVRIHKTLPKMYRLWHFCLVTSKDIPLKHTSSVEPSQLVTMHNIKNDELLQQVQLDEWAFHPQLNWQRWLAGFFYCITSMAEGQHAGKERVTNGAEGGWRMTEEHVQCGVH